MMMSDEHAAAMFDRCTDAARRALAAGNRTMADEFARMAQTWDRWCDLCDQPGHTYDACVRKHETAS